MYNIIKYNYKNKPLIAINNHGTIFWLFNKTVLFFLNYSGSYKYYINKEDTAVVDMTILNIIVDFTKYYFLHYYNIMSYNNIFLYLLDSSFLMYKSSDVVNTVLSRTLLLNSTENN